MSEHPRSVAIAAQNDRLRASLGWAVRYGDGRIVARPVILPGVHGGVAITAGVHELGLDAVDAIMAQVRAFDRFTPDNDPLGHHDFGILEREGAGSIYWKIDCFSDASCSEGCLAPEYPDACFRLLTIYRAYEH